MARIIYKEGLEGLNRLECIEGIEIELLNGQKALIYPKYAERALLEREKIREWRATKKTEEDAGYTVQPVVIPACAVGAPHRRDRVWFVARREGVGHDAEDTDRHGRGDRVAEERAEERGQWVLALRRLERRYDSLRDEVGALWRRIEWLCRDTDDRLSVERLEFQQKSKQARNLWTRLRHVEEALYISRPTRSSRKRRTGE